MWFLAEVWTPEWNLQQDAGRPFAEAVAELTRRFPEHAELIAAYDTRWEEMVRGAHDETIEIVRELKTQGTPLYCLTKTSWWRSFRRCDAASTCSIFSTGPSSRPRSVWSSRTLPPIGISSSV